MFRSFLLIFVVGVVSVMSNTLEAQVVRGLVLEVGTGRPIPDARIALIDVDGDTLSVDRSTSQGLFRVSLDGPNAVYVSVRRIGYLATLDGPVELARSDSLEVLFHMEPLPEYLDPIVVTARRRERNLTAAGYYDRERAGFGHFIDREAIEKRPFTNSTGDLLRGIPGVTVDANGRVRLRGIVTGGGSCLPRVYLDGVVFSDSQDPDPFGWERSIPTIDIDAIEVFRRPSEIPAQYGGPNSACGVILIWTQGD